MRVPSKLSECMVLYVWQWQCRRWVPTGCLYAAAWYRLHTAYPNVQANTYVTKNSNTPPSMNDKKLLLK